MVAGGLALCAALLIGLRPLAQCGTCHCPECSSTVHCSTAPPAGFGWLWVVALGALTGAIMALGAELLFQRWQRGTRVAASLDFSQRHCYRAWLLRDPRSKPIPFTVAPLLQSMAGK
mgnify:CR=1 FL=1